MDNNKISENIESNTQDHLEHEKEKERTDFERDKLFYYKNDQEKDEVLQRDMSRDYQHEVKHRKPSIEIVKEITKEDNK
jgi:hypothetical protein